MYFPRVITVAIAQYFMNLWSPPLRIRIPPDRLRKCPSCEDMYSVIHFPEQCPCT